jgi:hypothetical protein
VALDGCVDLGQELLLLRHHGQADVTLWGRPPAVRARRVPHLGLLLPLEDCSTYLRGKSFTPFGQQRQELRAPGLCAGSCLISRVH